MLINEKFNGFSLVELSIVLVILGLLTGGILAGQSLIKSAELRAISTESARYITATQTFRDKYFAIPGDFPKATAFWGRQSLTDCTSNSGVAVATATGVCDGDGSGKLTATGTPASAALLKERYQFWRHLASAGLIEGTYVGTPAGGSNEWATNNTNVPRSRYSNGLWFTDGRPADHYLAVGAFFADERPDNPLLTAEEAWNLDTKMDDGQPTTGKIIPSATGGQPSCYTGTAYNIGPGYATGPACTLSFVGAF